jgi:hypothetical protein
LQKKTKQNKTKKNDPTRIDTKSWNSRTQLIQVIRKVNESRELRLWHSLAFPINGARVLIRSDNTGDIVLELFNSDPVGDMPAHAPTHAHVKGKRKHRGIFSFTRSAVPRF